MSRDLRSLSPSLSLFLSLFLSGLAQCIAVDHLHFIQRNSFMDLDPKSFISFVLQQLFTKL